MCSPFSSLRFRVYAWAKALDPGEQYTPASLNKNFLDLLILIRSGPPGARLSNTGTRLRSALAKPASRTSVLKAAIADPPGRYMRQAGCKCTDWLAGFLPQSVIRREGLGRSGRRSLELSTASHEGVR